MIAVKMRTFSASVHINDGLDMERYRLTRAATNAFARIMFSSNIHYADTSKATDAWTPSSASATSNTIFTADIWL